MKSEELPVAEEFYTLQGEGYFMGQAAYFVRLAGCDVGCHWCDSKPSWHTFPFQWTSINDIIIRASQNKSKVVVVTGGEPFTYDLSIFTAELKALNIQTHVETSGTKNISGNWDWISFSPKPWNLPLPVFFDVCNELKVVIQRTEDFMWAEDCKTRVNNHCQLFLQPEWSSFNKILPEIVNYIKEHPEWRISIQAHKFMKIP